MEGDAKVFEAGDGFQLLPAKAEPCCLSRLLCGLLCALAAEQHQFGLDGVDRQAPLLAELLQQVKLPLQPLS